MFRLTLSNHPELCKDLTNLLSGILPHKNQDFTKYGMLLGKVTKLIPVEEMEVEYYLVFKIAEQILDISLDTNTTPVFSRDILESILDSELYNTIREDRRGFARMMEMEGLASDFNIEANIQAAANLAKQRAMDLYDEAFQLGLGGNIILDNAENTEEDGGVITGVMGYIYSLRNNYSLAVGSEFVQMQVALLNGDNATFRSKRYDGWYEFLGRNKYEGVNGWVDFGQYFFSTLEARLAESVLESTPLTSLHEAEELKSDLLERLEILAEYGIPPIDVGTPIRKTRYSVLIGKPNLGKTTIALNWAVNVLLEGKKVAIFSGENPKSFILYKYILPIYIFKKYGFYVTYEQVIGEEDITGVSDEEIEDRKQLIKLAILEVVESGNYMYIESLNAWRIGEDLAKLYIDFPFDYVMIDHTLSVAGGGNNTERLEKMSQDLLKFREEYQTSICLLSHPSPDAKKIVSREGAEGLVKYCKQIEADADDVFYIFDTPDLEMKSLIALLQTKGRDAEKVLSTIYLTKMFQYKLFRYDEGMQPTASYSGDMLDSIPLGEEEGDHIDEDGGVFVPF